MKKLFSKLMLVAMAAMTFTACEDVPEPYGKPYEKGNNTEIEGAKGTGTKDDPFNAIAALNYGNGLASGEISGDYYYIKGKVVSVREEFTTQYGNGTFYISEDGTSTNQFYVYRVMYLGNKKFASGDAQIAVGDDVVICAKITNYNGTIETAQKEGFLYELNGENRGGEPSSGGGEGTPTGDGTLENPYNAAAAIAYCKQVGDTESPKDVYIKGKVVSVTEQYSTQYGNATFVISDDGTAATTGFTVFRALYLGNKKYTSGDQIKEGDDVIVCGKVTNYRGNTPETVQGKAFLYSLNGKSEGGDTPQPGGEAKGSGTLEDPYNAAAANNAAAKLADKAVSDQAYYIKGKVAKIATDKNGNAQNFDFGTYGNATFYISDDGADNNTFYCYRVLYLENAKWEQGAGDVLKVGDEVVVFAKLTNYNGTYETQQNEGYLYSLNGNTKRGGGDTPQPGGEAKGTGTLDDPFNAAAANAYASALAADAKSDKDIYIKGKIIDITSNNQFSTQYGNCTFYISDDGTDTADKFYVFRTLYLGNVKYTEGILPKKGDEVIICGKVTNYKGNTPETVQNESYIYSLNGKTEGGGGGGEQQGGTGSLDAPNTVAQALSVINGLDDGATTSDLYYVKGKVAKISTAAGDIGPNSASGKNYKDINYYISDDGSENNTLYVYRGKNLDNSDFTSADQLQVGDEVIVYGKLQKYKNNTSGEIVPEMAQGNYLVKTNNTGGGGQGGGGEQGGGETAGQGSYAQPYNVAAVIANGTSNSKTGVYVKGYIVGWVDGQVLASGAAFNSQSSVKTNLLIADKASETDVNNCVPVQLPNNAVRTGLNLQDHPEFYGKEVLLYGNLEKYFGVAGIKSVTYAESNGQQIGTKP